MPTWLAWPALKLLFGGWLKKLGALLSHLTFWQIVAGVLAILGVVQHFELVRAHHEAAKWHSQFTAEHAGRLADRQAYIKAQKDAAAQNLATVAADKAQRERITHEYDAYPAELAALRARISGLLNDHSAAQGAAGKPGVPDLPNAAPVADDPARVSVPAGLYVRGAELELQLERLQQWVNEQVKVDPNSAPK